MALLGKADWMKYLQFHKGCLPRKNRQMYHSAEVNSSAESKKIDIVHWELLLPFHRSQATVRTVQSTARCRAHLLMLFPTMCFPLCMLNWLFQVPGDSEPRYAIFRVFQAAIVQLLGIHAHFSPPLPFPLFCFASVAPAASPFFSASFP